jgi:hypothetical protein
MANYSAIKITNDQTVAVATKSPSSGVTEITQMSATNHDFISVSIDDTTDTITGVTAAGTTITYQSHAADSDGSHLNIAFVS